MNGIYRRVAQTAFLFALVSIAGPNAQAQGYAFGTASYSAPGVYSTSLVAPIVTADFNGDGIPDVAMFGTISNG